MDKNIKISNKGFTHGSKFHADDVFSAALLTYINPDIVIERGFDVPEDYDGIIFDIGFGKYDHHQEDSLVRENGIPYAAFGLLWREFGKYILNEQDALDFDERFIQPLDLSDNTGCKNDIANIVSLYCPNWNESTQIDDAFIEAKQWALKVLDRYFEKVKSTNKAEQIVKPDLEKQKNGIAILTRYAPWQKFVKHTSVKYVIYHSQRGGYCAQAVGCDYEDENGKTPLKCPFPEEWRGKNIEELKEKTGVDGIKFCHNSGFLLSAETIDDAIKLCEMSMQISKS